MPHAVAYILGRQADSSSEAAAVSAFAAASASLPACSESEPKPYEGISLCESTACAFADAPDSAGAVRWG